jgi:hypothetical protein
MSEIVSVTAAEFSGSATRDGNAINAAMRGNADVAALDAVEMLLSRVHSEARRQVRFVSNPKRHWQRRSLHTLRAFAVNLVTVLEQ